MSSQDENSRDNSHRTGTARRLPIRTPTAVSIPDLSGRDDPSTSLERDLAAAVTCRLHIPEARTIVGLLGVRRVRSNHEEVLQWVRHELPRLEGLEWQDTLDQLCRGFVRAIDTDEGS